MLQRGRGTVRTLFVAVAAVLLAACVAVPPPAPELERLTASDCTALPLRQWLPAGSPTAVVVALHGFADHSGAFASPASAWAAAGVVVYAYDQRGFGASNSPGIWRGTSVMVADMEQAVAQLRARHPGAPVFLVGESMGAAVVLAGLGNAAFPAVDGIVLVAPAVWGWHALHPAAGAALRFLARLIPFVGVEASGPGGIASDNEAARTALARDPLVLHTVRLDMVVGMVDLMDQALRNAPRVDDSMLVLYGARDGVIPRAARDLFLSGLGPDVPVRQYSAGYHMLLRDLSADVVVQDVLAWMQARGAR